MTLAASIKLQDGFSKIFGNFVGLAKSAAGSAGEIGKEMEQTQGTINDLSMAQRQVINDLGQWIDASGRLRNAQGQYVKMTEEARDAIEKAKNSAKGFSGIFNTAAQGAKKVGQAVLGIPKSIANASQKMTDYANATRKSSAESNNLLSIVKRIGLAIGGMSAIKTTIGLSDELTMTRARLDMMNDGLQTTADLQKMIFTSAQRSRGSYQETADAISKMGLMAKDAFGSNKELVAFMEQINKQFVIAGTSADGVRAATLQLTQAMGSGVLRGEELNSIFEQAPVIIQTIADYLDVPVGKIRALAQEGELSASVVKNAMLWAADETNAKFAEMPMTFAQIWTSIKNYALMAFQPILEKINEIANSEDFQTFVQNVIGALVIMANMAMNVFNFIITAVNWVKDNLETLTPVIMAIVAAFVIYKTVVTLAAAAQVLLNLMQSASPIFLLIAAFVALIVVVVLFTEQVFGAYYWCVALLQNIHNAIDNFMTAVFNAIKTVFGNIGIFISNTGKTIASGFLSAVSRILSGIKSVIDWINKIPGVNIDTSGIEGKVASFTASAAELAASREEYKNVGEAFAEGMNKHDVFKEGWAAEAYNAGAEKGAAVKESIKGLIGFEDMGNPLEDAFKDFDKQFDGFGYDDLADGIGGLNGSVDNLGEQQKKDSSAAKKALEKGNKSSGKTAANTKKTADSVERTLDELTLYRDLSERKAINRYVLAGYRVNMTNNNSISNGMDEKGVVKKIVDSLYEVIETGAEGV